MLFGLMALLDRIQAFFLFGERKRTAALQKVAFYVRGNFPILEGLKEMAKFARADGDRPNDYSAKVYERWEKKVARGESFSTAIAGDMPEMERQLIAAADKNGRLSEGIEEAIRIRKGMNQITRQLRQAFIYPAILVLGATAYFVFMSKQVFPGFVSALPVEKWPHSTLSLKETADFVAGNFVTIYAVVGLAVAVFMWSLPHWKGRIRRGFDKYVPYSLYRTMFGTVFLLSLAGYVRSGMNVPMVFESMLRTAKPWYAERLSAFRQGVNRGMNIGEAMAQSKMDFPSREIVGDLRTFAKFRDLDGALLDLGETILVTAISTIEGQSVVLRNLMIAGFALMLLWFTESTWDFQTAVGLAAQMTH